MPDDPPHNKLQTKGDDSPSIQSRGLQPARPWLAHARWLLDGGWVSRHQAQAAFARMHRRDRIGDRLHLLFVILALIGILGPTTYADLFLAPLIVFWFVRILNAGPTWVHWFGQPAQLATLALAGWMAITLLWSGDPALGLDELDDLRWFVLGALVWPVIEKRRWLIGALVAGFLIAHGSQLAQWFGLRYGIDRFVFNIHGRNSGWWAPVMGGSLLTAALGLHLPAALLGRGRVRTIGVMGCAVTIAGLAATGTRGAWIASGMLIVLVTGIAFLKYRRRVRVRHALIGILLATLFIAGGFLLARDTVTYRINDARNEFARMADGDYDSYTGARVVMMTQAARALAAHPVRGVGVGGYRDWAAADAQARGLDPKGIADHAHCTPLHLAATTGAVGLGIFAFILLATYRGGLRFIGTRSERGRWSPYDLAPVCALTGLLLAGLFDAIIINTQTSALFWLLVGICPAWRPPEGRPDPYSPA